MKEAIFEVQWEHRTWRIYEDGTIEGFPVGSIIFNRILGRLNQLRAEIAELRRVADWTA